LIPAGHFPPDYGSPVPLRILSVLFKGSFTQGDHYSRRIDCRLGQGPLSENAKILPEMSRSFRLCGIGLRNNLGLNTPLPGPLVIFRCGEAAFLLFQRNEPRRLRDRDQALSSRLTPVMGWWKSLSAQIPDSRLARLSEDLEEFSGLSSLLYETFLPLSALADLLAHGALDRQ